LSSRYECGSEFHLFGAGTAVGTRLATSGHFLERLGDDLPRPAEKHARAAPTTPG
jgi:hypothetical protein